MPPLAQHGLRQPRPPGSDPGSRRAGRGHRGRPRRPRPSQPCGCLPAAARHDLTPVGHRGRGIARTPDAQAGHRTPRLDAGHLDARTPAPGTGQRRVDRHAWTLDARTGRRTLAEDTDTVTKARPASGPPGPPPPAAARSATNRVAADSAAALGNHDGSAVATPPSQDRLLHYQPAARSLRRPSRAPAHCSPRTMSGRA